MAPAPPPALAASESQEPRARAPAPHEHPLGFYGRAGRNRQLRFLPFAESTADVEHVLKTGPLQKAAGNHAAVAALAMHGQRNVEINLREERAGNDRVATMLPPPDALP